MLASEHEPGRWDNVQWRTPSYGRTILSQARLPAIILVVGFIMELNSADPNYSGLLIWGPVLWMLFVAAYPLGAWSEVFLTDGKLTFRRRFRHPAVQAVERDDIARLEIFEGSMMLVVHGREGELHRAWVLHDLMPLARAMDVATTRWRIHEYPDRLKYAWRWTLIPYLTLIFAGTVALVMAMPEALYSAARSALPLVLYNIFAMALLLLAIALATIVATILVDPIRRIFMGREMFALYRHHKFCQNSPASIRLRRARLVSGERPERRG